jgi:uncharacterized protein YqeY
MALKSRIQEDTKAAMRERDKARLGVLRLLASAIKQREVDERTELDDPAILGVIEKMVKQRREAAQSYAEAGRTDLADTEEAEIAVLEDYLPQPLSAEEIATLVEKAIGETGAASMRDMGRVMGMLKPRVQGRADMSAVSRQVKGRLGD